MNGNSRDAKRARTAQRILEAAQEEFALHGFEGATIRSVAERAGVHASLVMQHYGSKASLFAIAVRLPEEDQKAATDHLVDVLGVRMGELPPETRALVRSMLTVPEAEASMRDFLDERVGNLSASFEGDDAEARAALVVSSILGLTIARHFLRLRAFENLSEDALADAAHAWMKAMSKGPGTG
ncbi:TetR family transcriptional regulator [Streptomyces sp. NPDC059740]|uniref:TetR/AcrR family transcriptional regulator n=1 Tax=Streptomyces sp. NPDC059740 TaxID=3346926 RepID=UPI00365178EF